MVRMVRSLADRTFQLWSPEQLTKLMPSRSQPALLAPPAPPVIERVSRAELEGGVVAGGGRRVVEVDFMKF